MEKFWGTEKARKYGTFFVVIIGVYVFMKYLSPVLSPFLFAFLIAGVLNRLAGKIPIKVRKHYLAGAIFIFFSVLFVVAFLSLGTWLFQKCGDLAGRVPVYENEFYLLLSDCCDRLERGLGVDGEEIEAFVIEQMDFFAENMEVKIFPAVMNKSVGYMKTVGGIFAYFGITMIAVFLMLKDYEKLVVWMLGNEDFDGIWEVADKVLHYIKTYIKAQGSILLLISILCGSVLWMLGLEGGLWYGLLTGVMDVLPFIGTGIMLVPLALFQFLKGNYVAAVIVLCLYGGCALLRELLEPKLIGNKVGIWPVGILLAVFAGMRLFGIPGIIKGPISFVIIYETGRYLFQKHKTDNYSYDKMTED